MGFHLELWYTHCSTQSNLSQGCSFCFCFMIQSSSPLVFVPASVSFCFSLSEWVFGSLWHFPVSHEWEAEAPLHIQGAVCSQSVSLIARYARAVFTNEASATYPHRPGFHGSGQVNHFHSLYFMRVRCQKVYLQRVKTNASKAHGLRIKRLVKGVEW